MNRSVFKRGGASWCCAMAVGLVLLSGAWPIAAGEKQPAQNLAIPLGYTPGETSVTPSGTIHIKGFSMEYMMVSENPLVAGRITVTGNFNGDLSLDGVGSGSSLFEVGTWDLSSGAPVFTASAAGGLWTARWELKGVLAGACTVKAVGHGIAGEVEDMMYSVEGVNAWNSDLNMYVTTYSGWLLDPKK